MGIYYSPHPQPKQLKNCPHSSLKKHKIMQNKLLTLPALVDHLQNDAGEPLEDLIEINNWSDFLKQTVKLGDFIPCGEDGKPMKNPDDMTRLESESSADDRRKYAYYVAYEKAEAAVLFEGFSVKNNTTYNSGVQWISISNISGFYIEFAYRGEEIGIEFHNGNSGYLKTYADLAEATQENPLTIKK